jgi:4-methyl-5(b-hydroxyethyl)-thiazole monophosphate biosynthesis
MARVLIPLADGCEELEAVTLIDLLRRAGLEVVTAGLSHGGEPGASHLKEDPRVLALLKRHAAAGKLVAAICAAPKVLAAAGLLDGKLATSYPGYLDDHPAPGMRFVAQPVVVDGRIVTSRGPGTAMDFALVLIEMLLGRVARDKVEAPLMRP